MAWDDDRACGVDGCPSAPVVKLWRPGSEDGARPLCRVHAVADLRRSVTRIVAAYQPDVALSVFAEAHGDGQAPST